MLCCAAYGIMVCVTLGRATFRRAPAQGAGVRRESVEPPEHRHSLQCGQFEAWLSLKHESFEGHQMGETILRFRDYVHMHAKQTPHAQPCHVQRYLEG